VVLHILYLNLNLNLFGNVNSTQDTMQQHKIQHRLIIKEGQAATNSCPKTTSLFAIDQSSPVAYITFKNRN